MRTRFPLRDLIVHGPDPTRPRARVGFPPWRLSEDQKAMLKLVSQPDTGYEDIAALMGLSVDEVRAKVDGALAGLDSGGKAAPEPAAGPRSRHPILPRRPLFPPRRRRSPSLRSRRRSRRRRSPPLHGPPFRPSQAPGGQGRPLWPVRRRRRRRPPRPPARHRRARRRRRLRPAATSATEGDDRDQRLERARSRPRPSSSAVDGSDADGRALFGRAGKNVVLLLRAKGLEPAPQGQSYTVSLAKSPGERVPLIATKANGKGEIGGSFQIAPQVLGLLASGYRPDGNLADPQQGARHRPAKRRRKKARPPPTAGDRHPQRRGHRADRRSGRAAAKATACRGS